LFLKAESSGQPLIARRPDEARRLDLFGNQLTDVTMPGSLTALTNLDLAINRLTSFTLPGALTNLVNLDSLWNSLTNVTLPAGLTH